MKPKRVELLGAPVDCVSMEQAVEWVEELLATNRANSVIAVNPEKVMKASREPALLQQLQAASLLIPDGIGVVLGVRLLGLGKIERVPGAELMPRLCERAAQKGYKVFLFGGSPSVNELATAKLRVQYEGINVVGSRHGYLRDDEMPTLIAELNARSPDLLFVALGSPRQEMWMTKYLPMLNVKVCQGVGGTFDVMAGRVHRAPLIFRTMHLEWFYRLLAQPNRLLRQAALPLFAFHILKKRVFG